MVKLMLKNYYINVTLVLSFHRCSRCPAPLDACGTGCLSPPARGKLRAASWTRIRAGAEAGAG